jgi:hypothetical protein
MDNRCEGWTQIWGGYLVFTVPETITDIRKIGIGGTSRHEWLSLRLHGKNSADALCEQVVIWHHALM